MQLERLEYQLDAIEAVIQAINRKNISKNNDFRANPILKSTQDIDIKMETGTGKTYVYARLMHELKQQFGFFKFVVLVPGVAIKEGAKSSLESEVWTTRFQQDYNNQRINLGLVNAGDFASKKGKRRLIPESLRSFCEGSFSENKSIYALLVNQAMLGSKSMIREDYDTSLFGSESSPIKGIEKTRSIVIIDEPHRFKKSGKSWKNIVDGLNPQLIIRIGATFPEIEKGKKTIKDYENLVYDLNAVQAFNTGLVKGVHIEYPAIPNRKNPDETTKFKVKEMIRGKSVVFHNGKKEIEVKIGESLSNLHEGFGGIEVDSISSANSATLSNELELNKGKTLLPNVFAMDYQEILLKQALDAHFEKERENFYRERINNNPSRIKTNTLFFIDSVKSFRDNTREDKKGWLRLAFEKLLREEIAKRIQTEKGEYKEFLLACLQDIDGNSAGYFAEDNEKKGDEAIQEEVKDILRNREEMLRFKRADGSWNIRRFLFSKWTLREGWDNPNVFVIAKLRSSGSEISKLQEVGRGLRLPFDENGVRQHQNQGEDFRLTYIIDFSEREFAKKLIGEINSDGGKLSEGKITERILEELVKENYADSLAKVKGKLLLDDIIDENDKILNPDKLLELLPNDLDAKLQKGIVTGKDLSVPPKVKLNQGNFKKLSKLWKEVTKRYALHFEKVDEKDLKTALKAVLSEEAVFVKASVEIIGETIQTTDENADLLREGYKSLESNIGVLPYGEFLKRLNKRTSLPLSLIHQCISETRKEKETASELFNINTLEKVINGFEKEFIRIYAQEFSYSALDFQAATSIFKKSGNHLEFTEELPQGDIGTMEATDILRSKENYLYDKFLYDSEIEHEVLKVNPPTDVVAYGKLPRRSIKLPTYVGGTTSPDFIYAIKKDEEPLELYLVVETKSGNMRESDEIAVRSQEKAFKKSQNIHWRMSTNVEDFERELRKLVGRYV